MLDLAGIGRGSRVLDVAAGTGEQAIMAARRVGSDGYVLAVDISPEMLHVAADEAERERAWAEIQRALTDLEGPEGLVAPSEFLVGVGTKDSAGQR